MLLLVAVAYYTLAERKIMASVQRRLGPNVVGPWGLLQPLADVLKLIIKEIVILTRANVRLFYSTLYPARYSLLGTLSALPSTEGLDTLLGSVITLIVCVTLFAVPFGESAVATQVPAQVATQVPAQVATQVPAQVTGLIPEPPAVPLMLRFLE